MTSTSTVHPILGFARAVGRGLDRVADFEPTYMSTTDKKAALLELHKVQQRMAALRLRVMAVAGDVAEDEAAHDVGAWLAAQTQTERGPNLADLHLGQQLDRTMLDLAGALGDGHVNLAQAQVIAQALSDLPDDLDPATVGNAEKHLIDLAAHHRPRELARLGRKILEVVAPEVAEAEEGRRLEDEERRARETTSLHTKRLGDGSTRISIKVPDAVADRLATYLDAFTSPRHDLNGGSTDTHAVAAGPGVLGVVPGKLISEGDTVPFHRRRGHAFAALLERLDPARLPEHGGDATTVLVTVSLEQLRTDLAAAGVLTSDHGDLSAAEARRLACNASIVPVVLGAKGQVLDLGRTARLFSPAQRKALRLRDRRCRAEHCTVPAGWCEAHHWQPWSTGGPTELANGLLLCNWHHHRAHDNRYRPDRLPNGDVRFSRRT